MNDTTFDALANEHRRHLLVALLDETSQDAAVHADETVDAGALQTKHQIRTAMYHNHLPKLVDYGFIEWDMDTQEVVKGPDFGEIRPLLECIDEDTER
ncbi:helix-turn-helix domain-containing protein [Haloarcula nitratireducens]|uniref:Helix-turn-helix domain-containing protein n=1 Tax=Haloarcula nitratireducens TaxID=2487749 RepID=A0AAW4PHH8_9EURY|nr:helix-turn-helix domain-containing protein [Halomicroarcula nitratireducens]MBX0297542.1 helix-turn-helix domain-containing protein [Halomicroarcula nitratireducens]